MATGTFVPGRWYLCPPHRHPTRGWPSYPPTWINPCTWESTMKRRLASVLATGLLLLAVPIAEAGAPPASSDRSAVGGVLDTRSAIVVLRQQPLAIYDGHIAGYAKTRPSGGKLNPNSAAAKKYGGYLKTEHSTFAAWLRANVPSAKITSNFYTTLNGVAVKLNGAAIGKLRNNRDVAKVEYNALYHPSMSESYKVINA